MTLPCRSKFAPSRQWTPYRVRKSDTGARWRISVMRINTTNMLAAKKLNIQHLWRWARALHGAMCRLINHVPRARLFRCRACERRASRRSSVHWVERQSPIIIHVILGCNCVFSNGFLGHVSGADRTIKVCVYGCNNGCLQMRVCSIKCEKRRIDVCCRRNRFFVLYSVNAYWLRGVQLRSSIDHSWRALGNYQRHISSGLTFYNTLIQRTGWTRWSHQIHHLKMIARNRAKIWFLLCLNMKWLVQKVWFALPVKWRVPQHQPIISWFH